MPHQTRKMINRHSKKLLLEFADENGLEVNSKMSKRAIVDMVFKNKEVRSKLGIKDKRKLTENQKKNLMGFREKKKIKNEEVIKQKAQLDADKLKHEDTIQKPARSESQVEKLKQQTSVNKKEDETREKELLASTSKIADVVEQKLKGDLTEDNKQRVMIAEHKSINQRDIRFGEGGEGSGFDMNRLMTDGKLDPKKVKMVKEELLKRDPTSPLLQTILMLEGLQGKSKSKPKGDEPEKKKIAQIEQQINQAVGQNVANGDGELTEKEIEQINELVADIGEEVERREENLIADCAYYTDLFGHREHRERRGFIFVTTD